jgi:hypothetical protein
LIGGSFLFCNPASPELSSEEDEDEDDEDNDDKEEEEEEEEEEPDSDKNLDADANHPGDAHMSDPKPGCEHSIFSLAIQINNHLLSGI